MNLLSLLAFSSLLSVSVFAQAPKLKEPSGHFGGTAGGDCNIEWTTGNWTSAQIDVMTGFNYMPIFLEAVKIVDTTSSTTSLTHKCPDVDTSSTIYFYRMTQVNSTETPALSQRFCITANNGDSCGSPAHNNQPTGSGDAWGTGYLKNSRLSLYHQHPGTF